MEDMLYKKSSKGKIVEWRGWVVDDTYYVESGYEDGKKTTTAGQKCKSKNVGKSNETTCAQQAKSELDAKRLKKLDEGYFETKAEAMGETVLLPMLAHDYHKRGKDIKFPCVIQVKLDGVRALAYKDGKDVCLLSRKGNEFPNLQHIRNTLVDLLPDNIVLDGELYSTELTFQEITGTIRRIDITEEEKAQNKKIFYKVYDLYDKNTPMMPFSKRFKLLGLLVKSANEAGLGNLQITETYSIQSESEIENYHLKFVEQGYEGAMLRNLDGVYKLKDRSTDLQKYKMFISGEYKIVDAVEASGNDVGTVVWICETKTGIRFNVRPKGIHKERSEWWLNKAAYIGQELTVQFQGLTDSGVPRFPVGLVLRNYE